MLSGHTDQRAGGAQVVDVVAWPQALDSREAISVPAELTRLDTAVTAWLAPPESRFPTAVSS